MKGLKLVAKGVIVILILNLVAYSVYHVLTGGNLFGAASSYVVSFASFPNTVKKTLGQLSSDVRHYQLSVDESFEYVNQLEEDVHLLTSFYSKNGDSLKIELLNLKNDKVIHEWYYASETLLSDGLSINHPILFDDMSVIFQVELAYLIKLDAESNIIWKNEDLLFHHSLELDNQGYLWSPTTNKEGKFNRNSKVVNYKEDLVFRDDFISKVDRQSGKILFTKSVAEILTENGYKSLIYGFWQEDPIHLNDVQPVKGSSKFWQEGDLLLSCRNIHTIFCYRPSTNKVIWLKIGSWVNQHDVDILDSTRITVFNNNINLNHYELLDKGKLKGKDLGDIPEVMDASKYNELVVYDLENDSSYLRHNGLFNREKINTRSQGVAHNLENGHIFIEETDQGKLFIGNDAVTLLKKQLVSKDSSYVTYPGWSRVCESFAGE